MRRALTGLAAAFGLAALWRLVSGRRPPEQPAPDPAEELRRKLAEAREVEADRDRFDEAEGTPVDRVEEPHRAVQEPQAPAAERHDPLEEPQSLEERRRAVHERAEEALGRMRPDAQD